MWSGDNIIIEAKKHILWRKGADSTPQTGACQQAKCIGIAPVGLFVLFFFGIRTLYLLTLNLI